MADYIVKARIDGAVWTVTEMSVWPDRMIDRSLGINHLFGHDVEIRAHSDNGVGVKVDGYASKSADMSHPEAIAANLLRHSLGLTEGGCVKAHSVDFGC